MKKLNFFKSLLTNRFGVGAREHERRDEAAEDGVHLEEEEENSEEPVHDGVWVVIGQLGVSAEVVEVTWSRVLSRGRGLCHVCLGKIS